MSSNTLPPAYPLCWPEGWQRTPRDHRAKSAYVVTFERAREDALKALSTMAGRVNGKPAISITADIPVRLDGMHYANAREPWDAGVALWWLDRKTGDARVVACDQWRSTRENLRACGLTLEALRMIERSGATQILERVDQSFTSKGLPAPKPEWVYTLGLRDLPVHEQQVEEAFRTRSKLTHPDTGGSHQLFIELQQARAAALFWLKTGREVGREAN